MGITYTLHFFPIIGVKEEKTQFLKGHKAMSYQFFKAQFFSVTLQVLPFQKIIVDNFSHGGGEGGPIDEKNQCKVSFLLYKSCNIFTKMV